MGPIKALFTSAQNTRSLAVTEEVFLFWSKQCSSIFYSLLSPNLWINMDHMCKIFNIDGRLFTTHSLTYFNHYQIRWLHKGNHYTNKFDLVILYVRHKYYLENCVVRNNIDLLFIEKSGFVTSLSHPYIHMYQTNTLLLCNRYYICMYNINRNCAIMSASLAYLKRVRAGLPFGGNWKK